MSISPRARIAIVGAGISGLTSAFYLRRLLPLAKITVFESESAIGGTSRTRHRDGATIELGPNAVLADQPEIARLIDDLGLRDELRPAAEAASRRFLFVDGALREVGPGPIALVREGVLSEQGLLRAVAEPLCGERGPEDESVFDFFVRHFGGELAQRLAHPLTVGVCAGEAREVEMASVFPDLKRLERQSGSVVAGMLRARLHGSATPTRRLYTLPGGLQRINDVIAATPGVEVIRDTPILRIQRNEVGRGASRFTLYGEGGQRQDADVVVSAAPAWAAAGYLSQLSAEIAALLRQVTYAPMAVVTLSLPGECRAMLPRGFGFLVRRGEGLRMLGCQLTSELFTQQAPDGQVMLRAFFGGAFDPDIMQLDDRALIHTCLGELQRLVGLHALPEIADVQRWKRAIPQLRPGHQRRIATIDQELRRIPGLYLVGNAVRGLSWRECAGAGYTAASRIARLAYGAETD